MWFPTALAATLRVDAGGSLDEAAVAAERGDEIVLGGGTHATRGIFLDGVDLRGEPGATLVPAEGALSTLVEVGGRVRIADLAFDGGGRVRALHLHAGSDVVLSGVSVVGCAGDRGGAVLQDGGGLAIEDSSFEGNAAVLDLAVPGTGNGGAVFVAGHARIAGSTFRGNHAAGGGGVAADLGGTVIVADSLFEENVAEGVGFWSAGGGLLASFPGAVVERCTFRANRAEASGGGLQAGAPSTVVDSVFVDNTSRVSSGVEVSTALDDLEPSTLLRLRFCGNRSAIDGEWAPALRVLHTTAVGSNLLFDGPGDGIYVSQAGAAELAFVSLLGQDAADGAAGSAVRTDQDGSLALAHSLAEDIGGEAFSGAVTTDLGDADPDFAPRDPCGWPVPRADAVRQALPDLPDRDGSPGSLGATGGPEGPASAFPDADGDGWSDEREDWEGTDPALPDSDADGVLDPVDPDATGGGGAGRAAPDPAFGFGCAHVPSPVSLGFALLLGWMRRGPRADGTSRDEW